MDNNIVFILLLLLLLGLWLYSQSSTSTGDSTTTTTNTTNTTDGGGNNNNSSMTIGPSTMIPTTSAPRVNQSGSEVLSWPSGTSYSNNGKTLTINHSLGKVPFLIMVSVYKSSQSCSDSFIISILSSTSTQINLQITRIDNQTAWGNNYNLEWIANPPPLLRLTSSNSSDATPPLNQPNANCISTYCSGSYTFTSNGNPTMITTNHGLQTTPSFAYGIIQKSNQSCPDSFVVSISSWSSTQIVFQVQRVDTNSSWSNNYTYNGWPLRRYLLLLL